ncbi:MAG: hypothetical protein ACK5MQ_18075 [Pikeienuella sp.]
MREREWTNPASEAGDAIETPQVALSCRAGGGGALISGDLDAAIADLAPGAPMLGLLAETPEEGAFALRIARDRALLCTPAPLDVAPGWRGSHAVSLADDLYVPVQIEGDENGDFLGGCMATPAGSPSAMTLFAEKPCLVARAGGGVRVWVQRADLAEVWSRLALLAGA